MPRLAIVKQYLLWTKKIINCNFFGTGVPKPSQVAFKRQSNLYGRHYCALPMSNSCKKCVGTSVSETPKVNEDL